MQRGVHIPVPVFFLVALAGCVIRLGKVESKIQSDSGAPNSQPECREISGNCDQPDASAIDPEAASVGALDAGTPWPAGEWQNVTWNIVDAVPECYLHTIAAKPDEDRLLISLGNTGLWVDDVASESWHQLGQGKASAVVSHIVSSIVFDPADPKRYWETGIHGGVGLYETTDDGDTFRELGPVLSMDLVSLDFNDPARKMLIVGGHEEGQRALRSQDGGKTWIDIGKGLPSGIACTFPLVIDASTSLIGCAYNGKGIYRTTDAGLTWQNVSPQGGRGAPLRASDHSLYWGADFNDGLFHSTDDGQTWSQVSGDAMINNFPPLELSDGRIAMAGVESIVVSDDQGATWKPGSAPYPYSHMNLAGWTYSPYRRAFYIARLDCEPETALMRFNLE